MATHEIPTLAAVDAKIAAAIAAIPFPPRTIPSDATLDTLPAGIYYVGTSAMFTQLGLPGTVAHGQLQIFRNAHQGAAYWFPRSGAQRVYASQRNSSTFGAWT